MKTQNSRARSFINRTALAFALFLMFFQSTGFAYEGTLIPIGRTVGITVKLGGASVVNTTDFEGTDGKAHSPASDAGILAGDTIISIDGKDIHCARDFEEMTDKSGGKTMTVKVRREDKEVELSVLPEKSAGENKYRIGVWIKDSSSGIGTLTFCDPKTGAFAALGHGICDGTDVVTEIETGDIFETEVSSITRGEKGSPGELMAIFSEDGKNLGEISENTNKGIFGKLSEKYKPEALKGEMSVAEREEVKEGKATILSNIEGKAVEEYSAEIVKINKDENDDKCLIIKITDERLLSKTGGIVRGMSGSPIIQNGKLVGAVTHVFVNDPTRGYGIFVENMLAR